MLLNSPPTLDETHQSHGQAGYMTKDLRLSQLLQDLDLIQSRAMRCGRFGPVQ